MLKSVKKWDALLQVVANMQRHSSEESEIKISPNLLKNFNVYDILKPEKNGAKSSDATKVDKLIDIDDCSKDSGFQDADLNPALLDKNRDFDLVDLYQNIFVTPQHIKKKEEAAVEVEAPLSATNVIDAGFKKFFDMLESGQKTDWTNIAETDVETSKQDFLEKKPRVLVPQVFTEPDSDHEDLIDEILMQKKIEHLVLRNSNSFLGNSSEPQGGDSSKNVKKSVDSQVLSSSGMGSITKATKFENASHQNLRRPSEIEPYPVNSEMNNSLPSFTVLAIQKDEKVYRKKRLRKPESLTANYTKGPDFYEKSVVLPQIMARLNARLAYLDEKGNQKKRLILDAGSKPKFECNSTNVNAQVKAKPSKMASSTPNANVQVKLKPNCQTEPSSITKNDLKKSLNNASSSCINSLKINHGRILDEPRLCIDRYTREIRVHTTNAPCVNCGNSSNKSNSTAATSRENDYGKVSPKVLMEDCNKERLKALKQSQMFKDFVLKGKYDL